MTPIRKIFRDTIGRARVQLTDDRGFFEDGDISDIRRRCRRGDGTRRRQLPGPGPGYE